MSVIFSTEHLSRKAAKDKEPEGPSFAPLWEKHRELMRNLTLGVDIAFLHNLSDWHKADTVLEIGSGRGKFLEALMDYFPEKEYVGVDISKSKNEAEDLSARPGTVSIVNGSPYALSSSHYGKYDIIFVHSLSRQMHNASKFLRQVYRLLRPGGSLIIYEMNDDAIHFRPDPGFAAFFDELPGLREAMSGSYCHWKDILRAASSSGYGLKANKDVIFPSSYGDNKRHLSKIVGQLLELAEKSEEMDWNFASARRALQRWTSDPSSFGQFAIRRLVLKRPGGFFRRLLAFLFPF